MAGSRAKTRADRRTGRQAKAGGRARQPAQPAVQGVRPATQPAVPPSQPAQPAKTAAPAGNDARPAVTAPDKGVVRLGSWALPLDALIPVLLFVAALALYLPRINTPDFWAFDEYVHAFTAREYLEGNEAAHRRDHPCAVARGSTERCMRSYAYRNLESDQVPDRPGRYEWTHPPLGLELIAGGIAIFGEGPFGRRIAAALFGAIGIALTYRLGLALTRRRVVALLAAGLLLLDGLYFVQSRTGVIDIFGTVFMIGAFLAFTHYLAASPDRIRWPLLATGVLLGLALAVKWNAVYATGLIGIVTLWRLFRLHQASRGRRVDPATVTGVRQHLIWIPLSLILTPLVIQTLVHLPFFLAGFGVGDFIELQRARLNVREPGLALSTVNTDGTWRHPYSSRWWEWPLVRRPVWHSTIPVGDKFAVTYANGNPILYWAFLPAVAWVCRLWWKTRTPALLVLIIGFFGQWLPWMILSHTSFLYHFLPAVPFGCLAVAVAVVHLGQSRDRWRRGAAVGYVALVAVAFAFFYPIYSLYPMSESQLDLRFWFDSWK